MISIYKIINNMNEKIYIGKTKYSLQRRLRQHFYYAIKKKRNLKISNAIRKYGKNNFKIVLLAECIDNKDANKCETGFIHYYDSYHNGYNMTLGGDGGDNFSNHPRKEEYRRKISIASKRTNNNPEIRKKLIEASTGENNAMYGRSIYDVWVEKYGNEKAQKLMKKYKKSMSKKMNGRVMSAQHRKRLGEHNKIRNKRIEIMNLLNNKTLSEIAQIFKISELTLQRKINKWKEA